MTQRTPQEIDKQWESLRASYYARGNPEVEAKFTSLRVPEVSDNLLGTDDELDNILNSIDLEDCDLENFEVLINLNRQNSQPKDAA